LAANSSVAAEIRETAILLDDLLLGSVISTLNEQGSRLFMPICEFRHYCTCSQPC